MEWLILVSVFGGTLLLSSLLVPVMIRLAFRYDVLDHPGHFVVGHHLAETQGHPHFEHPQTVYQVGTCQRR